jgi:hypothetical protein
MTGRTALEALTGALRTHLTTYPVPVPCSIRLELNRPRIEVQIDAARHPADDLAELLIWAYTLHGVTASWWHTPSGNLHVTIEGRTTGGVAFSVFSGIDYQRTAGLVSLAPNTSECIALDELSALVGQLRELRDSTRRGAA